VPLPGAPKLTFAASGSSTEKTNKGTNIDRALNVNELKQISHAAKV
jgi:hypothetical protein